MVPSLQSGILFCAQVTTSIITAMRPVGTSHDTDTCLGGHGLLSPAPREMDEASKRIKINTWSTNKASTEKTDDIDKSLESVDGPVKAIVAHCGINDIRTKDPKDVSKKMVKSLKGILKDRPNLKVIVSKIPPVKDSNLQAKREVFNALVFF